MMLSEALRAWKSIVGPAHVVADRRALVAASTATFATDATVLAILRPATRDEVQACMRVATQYRIPVYPISSGKNWGYGSRVPARDGVLLDLGRLNRIVEYNEDLAFVTVEPGVTQRQLHAFLQEQGGKLWMDATGASPDCSIIGNTLERGFGHTPMGDHCANACGYEVVLPSGECLSTGYGRFEGSKVGGLGRFGLGPSLDGLFSQSNLGVVTRMTVWLMPAPEYFLAFFFKTSDPDGLAAVVEALRPLRLDHTLRSVVHIGNDFKVVAAGGKSRPIGAPAVPMTAAEMQHVRQVLGIGAWNGSGGLYGTKAQVLEARRRVKRALRGKVDRLQFVDDRLLAVLKKVSGPFKWLGGWDLSKTLDVLDSIYGLLKGRPSDAPMTSVYWPMAAAPPADPDPDRDRCGLLWCSPVVPMTGGDARRATDLASATLQQFGFDPQVAVSLATERTAICIITISYNRNESGADERAFECYRALTQQMLECGYPPYRLNVRAMAEFEARDTYTDALKSLKDALDPDGILAPGRYVPITGSAVNRRSGVA